MLYCVAHGRHPPNWIFEGSMFRPFHTLREFIAYIPTKFREYIMIGGQRYALKTKFETGSLAAEFYFGLQFGQLFSF